MKITYRTLTLLDGTVANVMRMREWDDGLTFEYLGNDLETWVEDMELIRYVFGDETDPNNIISEDEANRLIAQWKQSGGTAVE